MVLRIYSAYMCDIPWYIHGFPRDSFFINISMHFWATLNVACSGSQGDLVSPIRGGAGRALCEERLLSRSLCGDLG